MLVVGFLFFNIANIMCVVSIKTYEVGYGIVSANFLLKDYAIMNSDNYKIPEVMNRLLEEECQLNKIKHASNKDN